MRHRCAVCYVSGCCVLLAGPQGPPVPSQSMANTGRLWKMQTLRLLSGSWGELLWVVSCHSSRLPYNCCYIKYVLSPFLSRLLTPFKPCLLSCNLLQRCMWKRIHMLFSCNFFIFKFQLHFLDSFQSFNSSPPPWLIYWLFVFWTSSITNCDKFAHSGVNLYPSNGFMHQKHSLWLKWGQEEGSLKPDLQLLLALACEGIDCMQRRPLTNGTCLSRHIEVNWL